MRRARKAGEWLNRMLTNNIDKLEVGTGQYTFLLNQNGGIIDDLIVYRTRPDEFLLVVNASRTDEDFAWLQAHILPEVELAESQRPITPASRSRGRASRSCFMRLLGARLRAAGAKHDREDEFNTHAAGDRAHRLHRRRWRGGFLRGEARARRSGRPFWRKGSRSASGRAGSARAIRCASKCAIR
ncbi:MAG: hypothetical protein WKF47_06565 [Geodermatophilaceae bacterium]